jgi:multimeric flavodoxin WrbA
MTGFESFIQADNFILGAPVRPSSLSSQMKTVKKTSAKVFHQLQKIGNKITINILVNQALATMAKYVRTQF